MQNKSIEATVKEAQQEIEQQLDQNIKFPPQKDGFTPDTARLFGSEYPKKDDAERYNFMSTLDMPLAWREEMGHLIINLYKIVQQDGLKTALAMTPKIQNIIRARVDEWNIHNNIECNATITERILTDFLVNATYNPSERVGYNAFHYFGFEEIDQPFTVRTKDGLTATLFSKNPYIMNVSGVDLSCDDKTLVSLKEEIEEKGRACRNMGQRRTGRFARIKDDDHGIDVQISRRIMDALPKEIFNQKGRNVATTAGYYISDHQEKSFKWEDTALGAHSDTFYAPSKWSDHIITHVRCRKNFGHIPPLSFMAGDNVSITTMLYYLRHPKKGFEFVLPTLEDPRNPGKPIEVSPEENDILIMDNVKTYPFSSVCDIMLPATAAIHEVKPGTEEKAFVSVFVHA